MKKLIFILVAFSLLISACGANPAEETPPPLTSEDVQATAISMAWTMAAETIAAMPTATYTPAPPTATETPIFTATPLFTMTPLITNTPLPTATTEKDACDKFLTGWEGQETKILVVNETKTKIIVSLYLYQNARGYCGYIAREIDKKQSTTFSVPLGYYSVNAFSAAGEPSPFQHWKDLTGVLNPDKHTLYVKYTGLKFVGP